MSLPNICMVHPNRDDRIETFIAAHGQGLPNVVTVLHGGHMPIYKNGESVQCPELAKGDGTHFSTSGKPETDEHHDAARKLARYFAQHHIEVALAEYGPTGVALLEPCRMAGVPLVAHFHGYDASIKVVIEKYRTGYNKLFKAAAAIVVVSNAMKQALMSLGAPSEKLHIIPYGVNSVMFTGAAPEHNPPHFLGVGRFVVKKAPQTTILAFAEVARLVKQARLTIVGDGFLLEDCRQLVRQLGIEKQVDLPGLKTHTEVAQLMRSARAFVQHSVTAENGDMEGTPNSVLEASASGLPVVSTIHAGIPEAVIHETTGLLCDERDCDAMQSNMMELALNPEKAASMGKEGRKHIQRYYDSKTQLAKLSAIITQSTQQKPE